MVNGWHLVVMPVTICSAAGEPHPAVLKLKMQHSVQVELETPNGHGPQVSHGSMRGSG